MSARGDDACRSCGSKRLFDVLHWEDVPTNSSLFYSSPADAKAHSRGSLRLVGCKRCGYLFNIDAEERLVEYSERSMETQEWSARFREFATELAHDWVQCWGLEGKTILEVGCGRTATFLEIISGIAQRAGIGVDPVVDPGANAGLELIPARFEEVSAPHADAVVCRHTLEHIVDVSAFLGELRRWGARNEGAVFLFEVPNAERSLSELAFWDVYYEHVGYFTPCSLRAIFEWHGFHVRNVRTAYDEQYLLLEATLTARSGRTHASGCGSEVAALAAVFARDVDETIATARANLQTLASEGPLVVWQAGSKTTGLLGATGAQSLTALIDVNPDKNGRFLVGSGLPVFVPEKLRDIKPANIVLMNDIYRAEVLSALSALDVDSRLHSADHVLGRVVHDTT